MPRGARSWTWVAEGREGPGVVDRDGEAKRKGTSFSHTRNCNSFARRVNAVGTHPRGGRKGDLLRLARLL